MPPNPKEIKIDWGSGQHDPKATLNRGEEVTLVTVGKSRFSFSPFDKTGMEFDGTDKLTVRANAVPGRYCFRIAQVGDANNQVQGEIEIEPDPMLEAVPEEVSDSLDSSTEAVDRFFDRVRDLVEQISLSGAKGIFFPKGINLITFSVDTPYGVDISFKIAGPDAGELAEPTNGDGKQDREVAAGAGAKG